jgi:hypothetical protein
MYTVYIYILIYVLYILDHIDWVKEREIHGEEGSKR